MANFQAVYGPDSGIKGNLFESKVFWLSYNVPSRKYYKDIIKVNGGETVELEHDADIKIVDHLKGVSGSDTYSYKYIEDSYNRKTLQNIDEYAIPSKSNTRNPVAPTQKTSRTTRTPFTAADDEILLNWVKAHGTRNNARGNIIFQTLADQYPRHTYQSWRDRYVKRFADKDISSLPVNNQPNTPSLENDGDIGNVPSPVPRSTRRTINVEQKTPEFSVKDFQELLKMAHDILNVNPADADKAWGTFANDWPNHTAEEWRTYFEKEVLPIYEQVIKSSKKAAEEADNDDEEDDDTLQQESKRHKNQEISNSGHSSRKIRSRQSSITDKKLGRLEEQAEILKVPLPKMKSSKLNVGKHSRRGKSPEFIPAEPTLPVRSSSKRPRDLGSKHKSKKIPVSPDLGSSGGDSSLFIPNSESYGEDNDDASPTPEVKRLKVEPPPKGNQKFSQPPKVVLSPEDRSDEGLVTPSHRNTMKRQLEIPATPSPQHKRQPEKKKTSINKYYPFRNDPEDGSEDESPQDSETHEISPPQFKPPRGIELEGSNKSRSLEHPRPAKRAQDTQDMFDEPTQLPDLNLPEPPGGWELPPPPSDNNQFSNDQDEMGMESSQETAKFEEWMSAHLSAGHQQDEIVYALERTTMQTGYADLVLEYQGCGKGLPMNIPGIWTEEDDMLLHSKNAHAIEEMYDKHGKEATDQRMEFLGNLAAVQDGAVC
ncbi:MAG: hypothetical protein M1834_002614 [Cirrosporium novae-zelandiae]|nr:MAG: hypothetical protein M1834_002614 [Cirrosporium novae-zelandiae]